MSTKTLSRCISVVLMLALLFLSGVQPATFQTAALAQDTGIEDAGKNGPPHQEPAESPGSFESSPPEPSSKNAVLPSSEIPGEGASIQPAEGTKNYNANPDLSLIPAFEGVDSPLWTLPAGAPGPVPEETKESGKNSGQLTEPSSLTGFSDAGSPDPESKNYGSDEANGSSAEEAESAVPDGESKNLLDQPDGGDLSPALAAALAATGSLLTCGESGNLNWSTTSDSFSVVRRCHLRVPQPGWVFISANGSLGRSNGEYEAQFEIGIDSTAGDANIDRWVNVYNDATDGTDKSVALSVLKNVGGGDHTFYFLGKRYRGPGTVLVYDPTLTVIYVPAASATALSCGASGNANWTTTSSSFATMRQCSLAVPQPGWVFLSADGSLARQNGEYEAQFEIGIDSTAGDANIDRWVNVTNDATDGSDESVALSVLKSVGAGSHTFYSLAKRYRGPGTVLVYDPTLTVIYVPAASMTALSCGASGNANWTTTSGSFATVRQCNLNLPQSGMVFISADGSLARQNGEYEAQFRIGIDSTAGDANIDRWVNVYDDATDGSDRSVALSVLRNVSRGNHTFYFLAKRYWGPGTVLVYDPTLTVLWSPFVWYPGPYMPFVAK